MKSRARILIVDDEPLVRRMIREILLREGYPVIHEAPDGQSALTKIEKHRTDIVITDIRMPHMSGIELLIQIKARFPHTAVIVMTGFGDVHTSDEAKSLGADEYVTKPIKPREIEVIVERVRMRQMVSRPGVAPATVPAN
ncbi:MAG: response regulator [Candidatus Zixiibacteriota bacterium]